MQKTIDERVKECIEMQYRVDVKRIKNTDNFTTDLGGDSLDHVELIMAVENEFEIEIPDDDEIKLNTVIEFIEYVRKNAK